MPTFGPTSRKDLIRCLLKMGFEGPYSGGKHQFILKGNVTLTIPNPRKGDIGRELLSRILRQVGISRKEWEQLRRMEASENRHAILMRAAAGSVIHAFEAPWKTKGLCRSFRTPASQQT